MLTACRLPFLRVTRGSGEVVTETRIISDFSKLQLDGVGQLIITQGSSESLEIQAEDNILEQLTSEVQGDTLVLGFEEGSWRSQIIPTKTIIFTLSVVDLTEITLNGAGHLNLSALETSSLKLEINGAGEIQIEELNADQLVVNISGAGSISISGEVTSQDITIDGAGSYHVEDLLSQSALVEIAGLGSGKVWAEQMLTISIDGGGSVEYYGSPTISQDVSGIGDIQHMGDK